MLNAESTFPLLTTLRLKNVGAHIITEPVLNKFSMAPNLKQLKLGHVSTLLARAKPWPALEELGFPLNSAPFALLRLFPNLRKLAIFLEEIDAFSSPPLPVTLPITHLLLQGGKMGYNSSLLPNVLSHMSLPALVSFDFPVDGDRDITPYLDLVKRSHATVRKLDICIQSSQDSAALTQLSTCFGSLDSVVDLRLTNIVHPTFLVSLLNSLMYRGQLMQLERFSVEFQQTHINAAGFFDASGTLLLRLKSERGCKISLEFIFRHETDADC
jgi:hypothetical protein